MPPSQHWYYALVITIVLTAILCSTLFVLSMTFERFYSIIMPHKAASFNTVKRARITIVVIVVFSILYHIPHLFTSINNGRVCVSYTTASDDISVLIYYWFSFVLNFALPFVLLLIMNSVVIHTLRKRSHLNLRTTNEGHGEGQGQKSKAKQPERQIYITLLLGTFGFLILSTPVYAMVFYINFFSGNTPYFYAGYHLFYQIGEKTMYTNHAINFFLYVISGQKFRSDLLTLFKCSKMKDSHLKYLNNSKSTVSTTDSQL